MEEWNLCESCGSQCKSALPFRTGRNHCRNCNKLMCYDCLSPYRLHNKEKICINCEDIVFGSNDDNKHKLNDNQLQVYSQLIDMGFNATLSIVSASKCPNTDSAIQFITKTETKQKTNNKNIETHNNQNDEVNIVEQKLQDSNSLKQNTMKPSIAKRNETRKKGKHRRINSAFQFVKGLSKQSKESKLQTTSHTTHKRSHTMFDRIKLETKSLSPRRHSVTEKFVSETSDVETVDVLSCDQSVSECTSITRIITYLKRYQHTDLADIGHIFNKNNYPLLTDDFNHVLVAHLGDFMATSERQKQFECICDHICSTLNKCSLENCIKFQRNSRNREVQNICDNKIESRSKYYVETMDSMHCFFVHSFDVGFRIRSIEKLKINMVDRNFGGHQFYVDNMMKNMSKFLESKRERVRNIRGLERIQKTKFVTVFDEDEKEDSTLRDVTIDVEEKKQNNAFGALANEDFNLYFAKEQDPDEFMKIFSTMKMDIWKLQNSSIGINKLIADYDYDYNVETAAEQKHSKNIGAMNEEIRQKINEIISANTALCGKISTEIEENQKNNLHYSAKHPASTIAQWRLNVTNSFIMRFKNASIQFSQQLEKHTDKIRRTNQIQRKQKIELSEYDEKESQIKHNFFMMAAETDGLLECLAEIKAQHSSARFNNMEHTLKEIQKLWTQFNVLEANQLESLDYIATTAQLTEEYDDSKPQKETPVKPKHRRRSRSKMSFGSFGSFGGFGAKALEKLKKLAKQNDETADGALQNQSYSFGHAYNYWNQIHPDYVHPKYANLKFELTNNTIHAIDKEQFDDIYDKAKEKRSSNYAKTILAKKNHQYKINEGGQITLQHIMAVCFYTDLNDLQFKFSQTFRSLNKSETMYDCKQRNREYRILSKLLCEAINVFGTEVQHSQLSVFYHGVSKLLLFPSMVTVFNSPTSTTKTPSVAAFFATDRGAILELEHDHQHLRYFDVQWLSAFVSEDERLFIVPPDNYINPYRLRFHSIRSTANFETYQRFVHAFTSLNYAVNGDYNSSHQENKKDRTIIDELMSDYISHKNDAYSIPNYVRDIFKTFVDNKHEININMRNMQNYYQDLRSIFFVQKENDYGQLKRMEPQKIVQMELYHLLSNINNDIKIKKRMEEKNGLNCETIKLKQKISKNLEHVAAQMVLVQDDEISRLLKQYLKHTQCQVEEVVEAKANEIKSNLFSTIKATKSVARRAQVMKLAAKQMDILSVQTGDEQEQSTEKYTSMLKICSVAGVFNKCEQITVRYASFTKMGTQYFAHILAELCSLNKKNKKLRSIKLYNGYCDKSKFDSFQLKFASNGWCLVKETGFHGPKDIAIKRQNK